MSQVPHPTVQHTMEVLEGAGPDFMAKVIFIHLNHTNPLWDPRSEASAELKRSGYTTGIETDTLLLMPTTDA